LNLPDIAERKERKPKNRKSDGHAVRFDTYLFDIKAAYVQEGPPEATQKTPQIPRIYAKVLQKPTKIPGIDPEIRRQLTSVAVTVSAQDGTLWGAGAT
jgi:hypothetical protein